MIMILNFPPFFITSPTLFQILIILFSDLSPQSTKLIASFANLYFISEQIFSCSKTATYPNPD